MTQHEFENAAAQIGHLTDEVLDLKTKLAAQDARHEETVQLLKSQIEEFDRAPRGPLRLSPGDNTDQRKAVARKAVDAATALVDALYTLLQLKDQRAKFTADFQNSDFQDNDLSQLTAPMAGTLFDFVIPSLQSNFLDAANGGRNQQILQQIRKG